MGPHEMQIECSFVNNEIAGEHNNSFDGYIGGMGKDFIALLVKYIEGYTKCDGKYVR